jgi:RHH-type proline utilization regulon transcriptional repressor/proline dehydrogenase/delta 1-pyrroline-5-carboxylate dehydrogenase
MIGDPRWLATDIGPVIDTPALERLEVHAAEILRRGKQIERAPLSTNCTHGTFFAPLAVEIDRMELLSQEHFGPIIHVVRYAGRQLDEVIDSINSARYGLTLGVHSRVEKTWRHVQNRVRAGNCYINRGMTGAVVGVQPFGGEGLSGTGPKAGGPHYLLRFMTERTLTINTSAIGGNAQLLAGEG